MEQPYVVAIVVDPEFGEALFALAERMPVWVVDAPANRAATNEHRQKHPGQSHTVGITTFKVDANRTPEEWCEDVLPDVDLHHGSYSHTPPYSEIEVFGASLTATLRRAFEAYGLVTFAERSRGFFASVGSAA